MTALRTVGIAVLLVALFEPILRSIQSNEEDPSVVIALDVSASLQLQDGGVARDSVARQVIESLGRSLGDRATFISFDESVDAVTVQDSVEFLGSRTDLSSAIRWTSNQRASTRPGAVVLITDGNTNTGDNPLYSAMDAGLGVYSVSIGDTVPPIDASLQAILTSGLAVIDEPTPVSATIFSKGLQGELATVEFREENRVFATDTITLPRNGLQANVGVLWTPKVEGLRKIEAKLITSAGEYTIANNVARDFVEVRNAKRTVVIYAGAPSPDLTFIRAVVARDNNINVIVVVQKQGSEFYDPLPPNNVLQDAEACIFIGFPVASTPRPVIDQVARACKNGLSLLFIASKDTDYSKLGPLDDVIPFSVATTRPSEFAVTPEVTRIGTSDPLMKITGTERDVELWNTLPPVYRTETFVTPKPGAKTLATMRIQNVPIEEPLIMRRENGKARSLAVLAYGIYRWKLLGEGPAIGRGEQPIPFFDRFIESGVSWLSVRDNNRRVRIRSTRTFYGAGETVAFTANVLDASLAPVDDADVTVTIVLPGGSEQQLVLSANGGGRYSGTLGTLPTGSYRYSGIAQRGTATIGEDHARFDVDELGLEAAGISSNIVLLRAMADRTGAHVVDASRLDELVKALKADPRLRPRAITKERDTTLWHLPWPLAIVLVSFTVEWILRKRLGLV